MSGHDPRCERSRTPPSRCRCACGGTRHGDQATPIDLGDKQLQLDRAEEKKP